MMSGHFDPQVIREVYEDLPDEMNPTFGISDEALLIAADQVNMDYFWEAWDHTISEIAARASTLEPLLHDKDA